MVLLYVSQYLRILSLRRLLFSLSGIMYTFYFSIYFQWKKAEEKLERELREAEASESTERKLKLVGSSLYQRLSTGVLQEILNT